MVSDVFMNSLPSPILVGNYKAGFFRGQMKTRCFSPEHEFIRAILKYLLDRIDVCTAAEDSKIVYV